MKIKKITILPGYDKDNNKEPFKKIEIYAGHKIGIVGNTGSGKSQLLYDIEKLAQGDTKTKRVILINDEKPSKSLRSDPTEQIVGSLSQTMNFLTDATVYDFLEAHIEIKGKHKNESETKQLIEKVIADANTITGERIREDMNLTLLSGGQSRALMIADLVHINESPIVLIDEIGNVGIEVDTALKLLIKKGKIPFLVTHDPFLALNTDKRFIIRNGAINDIVITSKEEKDILKNLLQINKNILGIRKDIREGKQIKETKLSKLSIS